MINELNPSDLHRSDCNRRPASEYSLPGHLTVQLVGGHQELLGSGKGPIPAGVRGSTPGAGARAPRNRPDPVLREFVHRRSLGFLEYKKKGFKISGPSQTVLVICYRLKKLFVFKKCVRLILTIIGKRFHLTMKMCLQQKRKSNQ